jgi:uncharacterized protein
MKVFVKARPNSKEEKVQKLDGENFIVFVKAPPVKGMANNAIVKVLADYFRVSKSQIKIVSGFASREKIIEIL